MLIKSDDPLKNFQPHFRKGLLLDTNLMVVLLLGLVNKRFIGTKKAAAKYNIKDFYFLQKISEKFDKRVTTPHILTEVSNIASLTKTRDNRAFMLVSQAIAESYFEIHHTFKELTGYDHYSKLGLTDTGIVKLVEENNYYVMTNDLPLANIIRSLGKECLYYDELKISE